MSPKLWALLILSSLAVASGVLYYSSQPLADVSPVVMHHLAKPQPSHARLMITDIIQTATSSTVQLQTDTAAWKTYTNSEYGFEFKYPSDWSFTEYFDHTVFSPNNANSNPIWPIDINYYKDQKFANIDDWIKNQYQNEINISTTPISHKTNPNGIMYTLINHIPGESSGYTEADFIKGTSIISFSAEPGPTFSDALSGILSTFKFISDLNSIKNLPQDKCGCWDSKNNICLPQTACE